jgi:hypothetical protein
MIEFQSNNQVLNGFYTIFRDSTTNLGVAKWNWMVSMQVHHLLVMNFQLPCLF